MPCASQVSISAIDGCPLGTGEVSATTRDLTLQVGSLHSETIRLFTITSPDHHPYCQPHCIASVQALAAPLRPNPPESDDFTALPSEYHDLKEAFSKRKATTLPPHRPTDCTIDFLPGAIPPKGRVYPLSQPETASMTAYIQEELAKGFIRPSTSPASAGFFFIKKKEGSLRPCIDYRGLNEVKSNLFV